MAEPFFFTFLFVCVNIFFFFLKTEKASCMLNASRRLKILNDESVLTTKGNPILVL